MKLSDFEMDIMQLLWQEEPCTASQLHKVLLADKQVAYTTVKTIVDRLEHKGAIERCGHEGRAIVFRTIVTQDALSEQAMPSFMQRFFKGNSRSLIAHFIKEEKLNDEDIEYLQTLLKNKKLD
ncbi:MULTISPECIES: BlaI/MecI/CopY family transcriptional regulator [Pseudoalteromonas]|uniref:BlaI/MecI/CopY family transcriptional regulator n=1 Tax=Pseudoalteromonas agarivorans TaxID=176102 RepID=A0AAD0U2P7_9GAMM|nr:MULTISPECIES: BlaI/MecI/CopY family transcriptional regulator [Pseudoalteromonas]AYM88715.1 BlaI/MecI/CopY family transcriptional regulator [Pseudoalteromonas agarivorans]MDC9498417.1 BlaI/MecI/CopY family transcriptional regulator [Pseudoalteromonas sp. Angola-20]MDC9508717.1 BlaI/MecI/CopY family transcriptional regulator [Pseudoalteromonas sp. Angola-4]MDC9518089.1 BlaI/MecI/CopY family transcriptional regulator [Pseudoalteromonas sp. Angola-22]MDC9526070.1 BlaI/MecI/CopY family transcri